MLALLKNDEVANQWYGVCLMAQRNRRNRDGQLYCDRREGDQCFPDVLIECLCKNGVRGLEGEGP
jgi:hypothetical protein